MPSPSLPELEARRDRLKHELTGLGDFRPGSLVERFRKCGKPNCHCASPDDAGHGPSWSLTRGEKGKTVTKIIPAGLVPQTRRQLAEYQRFRALTRALAGVSERICEERIQHPASEQDFKKNSARDRTGRRNRR